MICGVGLLTLRRFAHPVFPRCFRDGGDCPSARRPCAHRAEYLTATERAAGYDYPDLARERCAARRQETRR